MGLLDELWNETEKAIDKVVKKFNARVTGIVKCPRCGSQESEFVEAIPAEPEIESPISRKRKKKAEQAMMMDCMEHIQRMPPQQRVGEMLMMAAGKIAMDVAGSAAREAWKLVKIKDKYICKKCGKNWVQSWTIEDE